MTQTGNTMVELLNNNPRKTDTYQFALNKWPNGWLTLAVDVAHSKRK